MEKYNILRNYTLTTTVCTLEEYMEETDETLEDIEYAFGKNTVGFVRVVLEDEEVGYGMRLFGGLYAQHFLAHAQATHAVTLELLQDYFRHLCKLGLA